MEYVIMWGVRLPISNLYRQKPKAPPNPKIMDAAARRTADQELKDLANLVVNNALTTGADDARDEHGYHVRVMQRGDGSAQWVWEICRHGKPLPKRIRDGFFDSRRAAAVAGRLALRELSERVRTQAGD